jgi:uncharacterized membrane protein
MKVLRLAFQPGTAVPMLALVFATGASLALVVGRMFWTGKFGYSGLAWNLFLAWVPLIFALLAADQCQHGRTNKWRLAGWAGAWLLFFPNAPYIFTDLTHLPGRYYAHYWVDLVLILLCAFTGLVLGFLSLYLMQSLVRRAFGSPASWCFIALVAALSGFGVYLGRFLRFNSWDVVMKPKDLFQGIGQWAVSPFAHTSGVAFPVLFGTFIFTTYILLYGLTHLRQVSQSADPELAPEPLGS